MSALATPIHTGGVGVASLRFFAPAGGARQYPWIAVDDLHTCLALPRDLRRELKQKLRHSEWKDDTRTVATTEGIVSLVPHYMAQGLIGAMQETGQAGDDLERQYVAEVGHAISVLTKDLDKNETLAYIKAAWNACGQEGGSS